MQSLENHLNTLSNPFWLIRANDLLTGDVVYLTSEGSWTQCLSDALLIGRLIRAKNWLIYARAQSEDVVGAELIQARRTSNSLELFDSRDRVRDKAPTYTNNLSVAEN